MSEENVCAHNTSDKRIEAARSCAEMSTDSYSLIGFLLAKRLPRRDLPIYGAKLLEVYDMTVSII